MGPRCNISTAGLLILLLVDIVFAADTSSNSNSDKLWWSHHGKQQDQPGLSQLLSKDDDLSHHQYLQQERPPQQLSLLNFHQKVPAQSFLREDYHNNYLNKEVASKKNQNEKQRHQPRQQLQKQHRRQWTQQQQQLQQPHEKQNHKFRQHEQQPDSSVALACPPVCKCERNNLSEIITVDCSSRSLKSIPRLPSTVQKVLLQQNQIQNVTCSDFADLKNMIHLDLSSNPYLAPLSYCTFKNQEFLEYLAIRGCNLTTLDERLFLSLKNMVYLDLSRNGITQLNPKMFSVMTSLKYLSLYFNELSHISNDTFLGLSSLKFLSLQRNKLMYYNYTFEAGAFQGLSQLESLNIQGNHPDKYCSSSVVYPDVALSSLKSLRNLSMDACPSTPGSGFRHLTNLSFLDFSTNMHRDVESFCAMGTIIPPDFFINFLSTQPLLLNMSSCSMTKIPAQLFKPLPNIESLTLSHNDGLTLEAFRVGSEGLVNSSLSYLDISANAEVKGYQYEVTNVTFEYLKHTKLKSLNMRRNYIFNIDPQAILDLPKTLEYINLRDNRIQYAPFLPTMLTLVNLKVVDGSNQLVYNSEAPLTDKESNPQKPSQAPQASIVEVSGNGARGENTAAEQKKRQNAPRNDQLRSTLQVTSGRRGNFASVTTAQGLFTSRTPRRQRSSHLAFKGRQDSSETSHAKRREITREKNIHEVPREHNPQNHVPELMGSSESNRKAKSLFTIFSSSSKLDKQDKLIKGHVPLFLPKRLEVVYMNNLKMGYSIPDITVEFNTVLRHVEYANNMAHTWEGSLKKVPSLQYLDLSENYCLQMDLRFFAYSTNLTNLYLQKNYLGDVFAMDVDGLVFSNLTRLQILNLRQNSIRSLSRKAFVNNFALKQLDISHNRLLNLDPELGNLTSLESLDLSYNTINGLTQDNCEDFRAIKSVTKNFTVDLRNNHLLVVCDFVYFLNFVHHEPDIFIEVNSLNFTLENGTVFSYAQLKSHVSVLERQCQAQTVFIVVLIMFFIHFSLTMLCAVFFYNRWKLSYLYYIEQKRLLIGATYIPYTPIADCFFVYDQEDMMCRRFVQGVFLPQLKERGVSYLIGEVDFTGGLVRPQIAGAIDSNVIDTTDAESYSNEADTDESMDDDARRMSKNRSQSGRNARLWTWRKEDIQPSHVG